MPFLPPSQQRHSTEGNISLSTYYYYYHYLELPAERDNVRNNARRTQARKTTHGLDGQYQDLDMTPRGRVSQNERERRELEKVRPWCGQPSDRGRIHLTAFFPRQPG